MERVPDSYAKHLLTDAGVEIDELDPMVAPHFETDPTPEETELLMIRTIIVSKNRTLSIQH